MDEGQFQAETALTYQTYQQPRLFEDEDHAAKIPDWHEQMLATLRVTPGPAWPDRFGSALRDWFLRQGRKPIPILSLFSGGGGLDIAFHDAGFQVMEMVELEQQFAETLQLNAAQGEIFSGSSIRCMDIREYAPKPNLRVDFVIGGPPCQTFSAAGRRAAGVRGTSDPRGTLFEEYVRILGALEPKGFLFENVYGITGAESGGPWREIQEAFRSAGYVITSRVLDAADYGTPQHRERLFIVGVRSDLAAAAKFLFPTPTHGPDAVISRAFFGAGEAIAFAQSSDETSLAINGRWGHLIAGIPPGLNYSYYTKEMGYPSPIFAWRSKFSDFMYKADPTVPVRTIKAQGGLYTGPISWENRHFSTAELKRLQTFPDSYKMAGGRQARIHQLGNSVPPQLGRMLALSILDQIFQVSLPFPMHYLRENQQLGFRKRKRELTAKYSAKAKAAISVLPQSAPAPDHQVPFRSEALRYLTNNFDFTNEFSPNSLSVQVKYEFDGTVLKISARPQELSPKFSPQFSCEIEVVPSRISQWHISLESAALEGSGDNPLMLTVLWKALEEFIATRFGIDDLVQLSGYYQYVSKLSATLTLNGDTEETIDWIVLREVTRGIGVSKQLSAARLASLWGILPHEVETILYLLRSMGFEVRSHRTNPQIAPGEFLIPYAFPTLTPRSVQLRKKL